MVGALIGTTDRLSERIAERGSGAVRDSVASWRRKLPIEVDGRPSDRERSSGGASTSTHIAARMTTTNGVTLPACPSPTPRDGSRLARERGGCCRPGRPHQSGTWRAPPGPRWPATLRFYYGPPRAING